MKKHIAVLPGDGIGPEIVQEAIKVLDAVADKFGHEFLYTYADMGATAIDKTGEPLPAATLKVSLESDAVLFGAIGDPKYDNDPTAKVRPEQGLLAIRKALGLFTNIRPVKTFDALLHQSPLKEERVKGTDFVMYRELTGGIYFGEKKLSEDQNTASDLCEYSRGEIERIGHLAFAAARKRKNILTLIDKANVLESSRLWRRVITELHKSEYSDVELRFLFVDNAAMQMILAPSQFDVLLTSNLFGDIISDEGSVIGGSIGLLPSASVGETHALFEPIHGSFPQGAGKGIANPIAMILSAAMMLTHFDMDKEAKAITAAVDLALAQGVCTPEVFPENKYTTSQVGDFIAKNIA
ncbi:MAG: 3-isopropylmalate dehydrogenase [Bacteroidetes bacterium]|nr:3-isopropylmalate dehydrogenase [Bacteroidota bacterium]MDA0888452.1 3-isopropylmalate dehydrogenase [Bacteroidota bacterium]MDA1084512.1 3-isopropylmalate dehydrogenase [Bacteroidota bacterium]